MVGMITNISDRKDTNFLSYNNTLSVDKDMHFIGNTELEATS